MKAIRQENQADDLFGRVRILLQVPGDMQYELILIFPSSPQLLAPCGGNPNHSGIYA